MVPSVSVLNSWVREDLADLQLVAILYDPQSKIKDDSNCKKLLVQKEIIANGNLGTHGYLLYGYLGTENGTRPSASTHCDKFYCKVFLQLKLTDFNHIKFLSMFTKSI